MRRGDVYDARLGPTEGSEPAGFRPVMIVSRDSISANLPIVVVVPCTSLRRGRRPYPSRVTLRAPEGGLDVDSVALCEQVRVLAKSRLLRQRGSLSPRAVAQVDRALLIALDLPG